MNGKMSDFGRYVVRHNANLLTKLGERFSKPDEEVVPHCLTAQRSFPDASLRDGVVHFRNSLQPMIVHRIRIPYMPQAVPIPPRWYCCLDGNAKRINEGAVTVI